LAEWRKVFLHGLPDNLYADIIVAVNKDVAHSRNLLPGNFCSPTETDWFGEETLIRLPIRLRLELVVPDAQVEPIIEAVLRHARTGQHDDGKIFILPYADAIRIRTEERGEAAL
jgi:hypothetical protein